jgi:hypothetical protein
VHVAVSELHRGVQGEGDGRELDAAGYHSVKAEEGELTATVVLTRNPRGVPTVVGDVTGAAEYVYRRTAYSDDARSLLDNMRRTLGR